LRAKFAAYYRYLASARAAREFDGPPSVVVVTAGPGAEDRLTDAVMAAEVGQPRRLPLLLTTVSRVSSIRESTWSDALIVSQHVSLPSTGRTTTWCSALPLVPAHPPQRAARLQRCTTKSTVTSVDSFPRSAARPRDEPVAGG